MNPGEIDTSMIPPPFSEPPPPPAVPRNHYRVQMAKAMHEVDCGCTDFKHGDDQWGDGYYDMLAAAAWAVVEPEIARLRHRDLAIGGGSGA